jgi:hypothetical protein
MFYIQDKLREGHTMSVICPICKKECKNISGLFSHMSRQKDLKHKLLITVKKYKDITTIEKLNSASNIVLKMDDNKLQLEINKLNKKIEDSININKKINEIIEYFYKNADTICINFNKDRTILKGGLNKGLTIGQILIVVKYLLRKGYKNLNLFSHSINDAMLEKKYTEELHMEGTIPNLVNKYYSGLNLIINPEYLIKDVRRIEELLNVGYSKSLIEKTIDNMIKTKCTSFNFIKNKIIETNVNLTKSNKTDIIKIESINLLANKLIKNNINCASIVVNNKTYDANKLIKLKSDIINGKVKLSQIPNSYLDISNELARLIYKYNLTTYYGCGLNRDEWSNRVEYKYIG